MAYRWNFEAVFNNWQALAVGAAGTLKLFVVCASLGLSLGLLFLDCLPFYAAQLHAVTEEQVNEVALGVDGPSLFHDQHGQQAVGNHKQNGQHGKERTPGLVRRVIVARQVQQMAPRSMSL